MDLYNLVLSAKITKGEGGGGGDEPTGTKEINITQNGVTTEDVKSYASAKINTSVPNSYAAGDEGKVVSNGALVAQTSKNVTSNGTVDTTTNNQVVVNVPVPSGYIKPSGTKQISSNGSYDVSNFASAAVNISPIIQSLSISENGTYSVPSGVDGYNPITVNVSGGGGGDHDAEDGIITGLISGVYENIRVTRVWSYAFYSCTNLTTANFPNATSIGNSAFNSCTRLTTVSFPNVTSIGNNAFQNCSSLTTASFSNATSIGNNAFYNCTNLTTASFSNATSIGNYAFYNCTRLTTANFPNATSIGNSAFYSCTNLTTASFPLGKSFGSQCFCNCTHLESLYVLASSVATLGTSAFVSTPMSLSSYLGHFGSIYVPASLVDTYKSATNWSAYSARITSYVE